MFDLLGKKFKVMFKNLKQTMSKNTKGTHKNYVSPNTKSIVKKWSKKKKISLERLNSGYAEAEILMKLKTGQLD